MTTILYNGSNPFSGIAPAPLVSRSVEMIRYGDRWGELQKFSLKGTLTGDCTLTTAGVLNLQQKLISGFNSDFKHFQVYDGVTQVLDYDLVRVANISFDSNNYAQRVLPFTIDLEVYPQAYFSGQFGVLEPKEEIGFTEGEDGLITITHSISAHGFNTNGSNTNALDNAKSFVAARTGWQSVILPQFITSFNNDVCLREVKENYDRLNAVYQVQETYVSDSFDSASNGILRYSTDFSSGIDDGICRMKVKGEIRGCKNQSNSSLRSRYSSFNAFNEAINQFQSIAGRTDLNSIPVEKTVSEDSTHNVIQFDYLFNDDLRPKVYVDYNFAFNYDFESDTITVAAKADVFSKAPYDSTKWQSILNVGNQINLYSAVTTEFLNYTSNLLPSLSYLQAYPLNPVPISKSRTENQFAFVLSLEEKYSNKQIPPYGFDKFDYSLNFSPSIEQYAPGPVLNGNGNYIIQDLGFSNRAKLNIEVNAVGNLLQSDPTTIVKLAQSQVTNLQNVYFLGKRKSLDSQSYDVSNFAFDRSVKIQAGYSCEQSKITI